MQKKKDVMDAVLVGSVDWVLARQAAYRLAAALQGEVADLQELKGMGDAYSPMAWLAVCRQLQVVTDGMTVMRLLAQGKTSKDISAETGILAGSIAAYKAWNTMYAAAIDRQVNRHISIKGRNKVEQAADIAFLRSCGIAVEVQQHLDSDVNKVVAE